ncbi:hypothetical protein ACLOJK_034720, partial [Asimina triloba]
MALHVVVTNMVGHDLLPTRAKQSWPLMIEAAVERTVRREEVSLADEGFMLIGVGVEAGGASNGRPGSTDPGLPATETKADGYGRNRRRDE